MSSHPSSAPLSNPSLWSAVRIETMCTWFRGFSRSYIPKDYFSQYEVKALADDWVPKYVQAGGLPLNHPSTRVVRDKLFNMPVEVEVEGRKFLKCRPFSIATLEEGKEWKVSPAVATSDHDTSFSQTYLVRGEYFFYDVTVRPESTGDNLWNHVLVVPARQKASFDTAVRRSIAHRLRQRLHSAVNGARSTVTAGGSTSTGPANQHTMTLQPGRSDLSARRVTSRA